MKVVSTIYAASCSFLLLIFLFGEPAFAAPDDIAPPESTDPGVLPNVVPSKLENADSAFAKLDIGKKGYLTNEDTKVLTGFDEVFTSHDEDGNGKLVPDEFIKSWESYTGIPSNPENFQRTK
jgi:hypothetical protein